IQDLSRDLGKQVKPSIGSSTCEYYDNKSRPSVTHGFQFSNGASSSSSMVAPRKVDVYTHVAQPDDLTACPTQESTTQMDTMQPMASSQSSKEELLAQDGSFQQQLDRNCAEDSCRSRFLKISVKLLMDVRHKNITLLVGYCNESNHKGIIYEYMANGNLGQHLFDGYSNVLSWERRLQIGCDAAEG
nr:leucine-rich repeat transmembrane protein kinase protein [Tanacetum cinerariifolium]